jgi:hypothetical protein
MIINRKYDYISTNWNLLFFTVLMFISILAFYIFYSEVVNKYTEDFLGKAIAGAIIISITVYSNSIADKIIMGVTSLPSDMLPRAQAAITIFFNLYFILFGIFIFGLLGYFIAIIFHPVRRVKSSLTRMEELRFLIESISLRIRMYRINNYYLISDLKDVLHETKTFFVYLSFITLFFSSYILLSYIDANQSRANNYIIIYSSFIRNDDFSDPSNAEGKLTCYNVSSKTFVKIGKEKESIFADWEDSNLPPVFSTGECITSKILQK